MGPEPTIARHRGAAPAVDEVQELYAAASAPPPLTEPASVAAVYAALYRDALGRGGVVVVSLRDGERLVGVAYGRPWHWAEEDDPWSSELRVRLGAAAPALDGTFAVHLLAVHPAHQGHGHGSGLLGHLLREAGTRAWLLTRDEETPARRLYEALGWRPIGHGPDAPNGRPGLVMVSGPGRQVARG